MLYNLLINNLLQHYFSSVNNNSLPGYKITIAGSKKNGCPYQVIWVLITFEATFSCLYFAEFDSIRIRAPIGKHITWTDAIYVYVILAKFSGQRPGKTYYRAFTGHVMRVFDRTTTSKKIP